MPGVDLNAGRGPILLIVTWIWACIATLLYITRAIKASRDDRSSLLGIRWDFAWVTIAYITAMAAESFMTVSVVYGTGIHQSELTEYQTVTGALWSWIGQVCAIMALVWGRFAVIAFLLNLQGKTYRLWRYALYVVAAAQGLINVIEIVLILKQCTPVQRLWDQSVPGTCDLIEICSKVGFLQGSIGAFADFFLALYPPAVIIGPLQQVRISIKIGLCLIMGGGVVAGIAGVVKTVAIESITHTDDISYSTLDLLIWVLTEMWFIIIFGSIPTIRSVFINAGRSIVALTKSSYDNIGAHRSNRDSTRSNQTNKCGSWAALSDDKAYDGHNSATPRVGVTSEIGRSKNDEESAPRGNDIMVTTNMTVSTESDDSWRL